MIIKVTVAKVIFLGFVVILTIATEKKISETQDVKSSQAMDQ